MPYDPNRRCPTCGEKTKLFYCVKCLAGTGHYVATKPAGQTDRQRKEEDSK